MFKLRQDLYERREKADRLKLAFASAAIAGIGASVSFACLGEVGASIYGISLLASISAAIEIQTQMDNSDEEERRSSPEVKKLAERLAKKFSLATPDVYISREIKTYEAGTDGKIIEMGLDYEACSNHIQAQIVIGHELGHIYHKDCLKRLLLASFKLSTLSVLGATAIEPFFRSPDLPYGLATTMVALGVALQQGIHLWAGRICEYRADRFELKHTDHPLELAEWLQKTELGLSMGLKKDPAEIWVKQQSTWNSMQTPSLWERLQRGHPPVPHRIKALVQLCERVADHVPPESVAPPTAP